MSRRQLFGFLRRPPEPEPEPEPAFVLDDFYGARTPARELPRFAIRGSISAPTTRVGLGRSATSRPEEPTAAQASRAISPDLVPHVLVDACLATTTSCSVCVERCPVPGSIELVDHRPYVVADHCDGCGICVQVCPAPILAFELVERAKAPP